MSAEQVALIPQCAECGEVWLPADEDRWQAHPDTDDELVFYCPECAELGVQRRGFLTLDNRSRTELSGRVRKRFGWPGCAGDSALDI